MSKTSPNGAHERDFADLRQQMVHQLRAYGIRDEKLLDIFLQVPRDRFVPDDMIEQAYADKALPLGLGQTISQPLIVAMMTAALQLQGDERVLEIGTGSGYQAAILAQLCGDVYTVERIPELSSRAEALFDSLEYRNIHCHVSDGTLGWAAHAPYDNILVTAASPKIPPTLLEQLKPGGRLVIPVGSESSQEMTVVEKTVDGSKSREIGGCRFVKLIGQDGWPDK